MGEQGLDGQLLSAGRGAAGVGAPRHGGGEGEGGGQSCGAGAGASERGRRPATEDGGLAESDGSRSKGGRGGLRAGVWPFLDGHEAGAVSTPMFLGPEAFTDV